MAKKSVGYMGNAQLKKRNTQHEWTKEMVDEYVKCSKDPIYFIETYMKIINVDKGLISFKMFDFQKDMVKSMKDNRHTLINTARQVGKELLLDCPLPLFSGGFTTMGEVRVGDNLIDADGHPTIVTSKSKIQMRPTYRITFDDKTFIDAGDNHQWEVHARYGHTPRKLHIPIVMTTEQLFNSEWRFRNNRGYFEYKWYIPNAKPVDYQQKNQKIDPYVLGVWLGNGYSASNRIMCLADDFRHYESQHVEFGRQTVVKNKPHLFEGTLTQVSNENLSYYNLRNNKHIPDNYLYGSIEQRIQLIQGLFDTDGFVEKNGYCCIQLSTRNMRLIDNIHQLFCSMGVKVHRTNHIDKKQNKTSVRLSFTCGKEHFQVSTLERKNNRQKSNPKCSRYSMSRTIQNIELIKSAYAQCVSVDNPRHLYLCGKNYLPTHNSTSTIGFLMWYTLFTADKTVALLANKGETAREILSKYHLAYQYLPKFLQQGTIESNKGSIELENNSRIIATSTSTDSIRGYSVSLLFIDEMAFVENWDQFAASTLPTITSGKTTKTVFVSSPFGLNHFYRYWTEAVKGKNGYNPIKVIWSDVPGRDEKWKADTLALLNGDVQKFQQENEAEFLGSSNTLISGAALKTLIYADPLVSNDKHLNLYIKPELGHRYMITVDTSEGKGLDYSAFSVIDVTALPYTQVCAFRNNEISPAEYCQIIFGIAKEYNDAYVLCENNSIGYETARCLKDDLGYEMMLYTANNGRGGKILSTGYGKKQIELGLKMNVNSKKIGCSMLKLLIEGGKLIVNDFQTIKELNTFSRKNASYQAEVGCKDDLVMSLLLFAWASKEKYFEELTDINTIQNLRDEVAEQIEEQLLPFVSSVQDAPLADDVQLSVNDDRWLMFDDELENPLPKHTKTPRFIRKYW